MFETETVEPCLVRKLKWREGVGGAWRPSRPPSGHAPANYNERITLTENDEIIKTEKRTAKF